MINVSVIGVGYWGPNMVRNFNSNSNTNVVSCCDLETDKLNSIKANYPSVNTVKDYREIINDTKTDMVVICTPVSAHYKLAKETLEAGKHVLIEKPMTLNSAQGEALVELAEAKGLKIFVDHTFIYTGAARKMKELVVNQEIGDLYYFDSVRLNLGLFQHDVNVIWDLAPHDISIMHFLLDSYPSSVVATGAAHLNGLEDVAYLTVYYPNNLIAHIHTNWLSPVKIRQTLIAGSKKMIVWDDNTPSEKVRVYDKGVDYEPIAENAYERRIQYRTGDMYCPKLDMREALAVEVDNIVSCLENNTNGFADGQSGLMVVKILEAAQESLKQRGKEIKV